MHDKLREFEKASGLEIYGLGARREKWEAAMTKFAELIVRECIRVPYDMWDKAELNADIAVKIEHRIKEHFGVEE